MGEIVYLNGRLLDANQAKIDPAVQGFLYGAGLFETMRAYSGRIFLLNRHLERLLASARALDRGAGCRRDGRSLPKCRGRKQAG